MPVTAYIAEQDTSNFRAWTDNVVGNPNCCLFTYNNAAFIALRRTDQSNGNPVVSIYRSTDGFVTVTRYDGPTGFHDLAFALDGNTLWIAMLVHNNTDQSVTLSPFVLNTLAFGASITGGPTVFPGTNHMSLTAYQGTLTFFYVRTPVATPTLYLSLYNSGWGSESLVETLNSTGCVGIGVDPATGNVGFFYQKASNTIRFRSVVSGVLSSPADISDFFYDAGFLVPALYIPEEDKFALPNTNFGTGAIELFTATPSVNPTTVAKETIATPGGGTTYRQPCVRRNGANVVVFYQSYASNLAVKVFLNSRTAGGGAWGGQATLFDRATDTYIPNAASKTADSQRGFSALDATTFSFEAQEPGTVPNQYVVTPAIILPIELECPVLLTFTSDTPFSTTPVFSGGLPPYTFTATGLPEGVTINSSTGTISGTVVLPGTYEFTITITDSLGSTLTVECALIIEQCPNGQAFVGG